MNTSAFAVSPSVRTVVIGCGLVLAFPATAQQDAMQGMQMSQPAGSSSTPAPASSARVMQGMDMSTMHGLHMPSPQKSRPASAPASASSSGHSMHGTEGPSMQGMAMHGTQSNPSRSAKIQHLRSGNMIGTRPKPIGLAEGMHMQDMNTSSMEGMEMSSMQGGKAPPDARSPDYSDGYRHTDMQGMAMSDHAKIGMLLIDQLEYAHDNHGNNAGFLDAQAWYGEDFNKLWLKVEGESADGKLEDLRTEVLWDHAISSYWGTQLGVRQDFGEGPERTWAAFGVQGLAPYWFDTEATLYVGQQGRTAARVQFEYEELLTQRLVLQPKFEVNFYGKDDPQRGIGSGLSDAELGVRLRYEIRREFAPYIGVVWRQRFGRTADFARAKGESADELQFVAGLRFWF